MLSALYLRGCPLSVPGSSNRSGRPCPQGASFGGGEPWRGRSHPPKGRTLVRGGASVLPWPSLLGREARRLRKGAQVGEAVAQANLSLVSGGAAGIDRASVRGSLSAGGTALEVLPFGLSHAHGAREGTCRVSVCAPSEPFSSVGAMERNALIYAASPATLVVQPRLREGGSWHGAVSALRRRLREVRVFHQVENPACRALEALGAVPVTTPAGAIAPPSEPPSLFSPRR